MLGLTLLLANAATTLDQLCLLRISRDTGVLTPEYLDATLVLASDGPVTEAEMELRQRLAQMTAQLRVAGAAASARAILDCGEAGRRQTALLALAGTSAWCRGASLPGGGQIHYRLASDGQVYLLAGMPSACAAHAPHAARGYVERLWVLPAGHPCAGGQSLPSHPSAGTLPDGPDSLSLDAALRDLVLQLAAAGQDSLAGEVAALHEDRPQVLPAMPARALPQAPAAAA